MLCKIDDIWCLDNKCNFHRQIQYPQFTGTALLITCDVCLGELCARGVGRVEAPWWVWLNLVFRSEWIGRWCWWWAESETFRSGFGLINVPSQPFISAFERNALRNDISTQNSTPLALVPLLPYRASLVKTTANRFSFTPSSAFREMAMTQTLVAQPKMAALPSMPQNAAMSMIYILWWALCHYTHVLRF